MYEHRREIALALLLIALSIYAALYAIQRSTTIKTYQKTENVTEDAFWGALNYRTTGLQQSNDDVKHISSIKDTGLVDSHSNRKSGVIGVAILIPTTTNKIKYPSLHNFTLMTECLPSIKATVEPKFNYKVYIGTENNDFLVTQFDKIKSLSAGNIEIIPMIVKGGTFNIVINEIARQAYKDGVDYMCRINDDTTFMTKNWTSFGIKTLSNFEPANVGVVGPTCRQGNIHVMTHDMVHRTHLEIFNYYYPPVFENWFLDDWITLVYKPNRSIKLETWEVFHSLKQGTRYTVHFSLEKFLAILVTTGKVAIESYSIHKSSCQKSRIISFCLFGSEPSNIEGAVANTKIASQIFPEWIVRIYHDDTVPNQVLQTIKSENVQFVKITTKTPFEPKEIWNLFVATDPCLERYLIRNINTRLTARERAAVDQWIDSGKRFHIIRDHPVHVNDSIPSGLWGGTKDAVTDMMSLIHKYIENRSHYGTLQQFLNREIWQLAKMSVLQHDSVSCEKYPGSVPSPTKRQGFEFIGAIYRNGTVRQTYIDVLKNSLPFAKCLQ